MPTPRQWLHLKLALTVFSAGCGSGEMRLPAPAAIAEELATDCRFTLDDAEVNADEIVVDPESERGVGVKFRLVHPDQHRDGVLCFVRILGVNAEGREVMYGHYLRPARLESEGRAFVEDKITMPTRPGEYQLEALIHHEDEDHLIGRMPLRVKPEG